MHGSVGVSSLPFLLCMLLLLVPFQSWFCVALVCQRSAFTLAGCLNLNSPQRYAGFSLQLLLLRVPSAAVQTFQKGTEAQCALLRFQFWGIGWDLYVTAGQLLLVGWSKQLQSVLVTVLSHVHVCAYLCRIEGLQFSLCVIWQRKR
jgi:hypothetical protein